MKFALKPLKGGFQAVKARRMVEPEQTIRLFAAPAETAREFRPGDAAVLQQGIEKRLERRQGRQLHESAAGRDFRLPRMTVKSGADPRHVLAPASLWRTPPVPVENSWSHC